MLVGLSLPSGVLVDRYHRGAIVMVGDATFAIPEAAIVLLECARDAGVTVEVNPDDEDLIAALVAGGLLIRDRPRRGSAARHVGNADVCECGE